MSAPAGELKKDRVYRTILEMISNGNVADGKFPSEPEFCKLLNVSRVTLRSALQRLENEGIIIRSQYYGTRVVQALAKKTVLIAWTPLNFTFNDRKTMVVKSIESSCRKRKLLYDFQELHFLMDPEKLAEKYCGIILFGAAIEGNEPFMHTIRQSGLPVIYCREDDNNTITESIASVGVDMKKAYLAGLDYLLSLGFRRIMLSTSDDERTCQRLGFSHQDLVRILNERNLPDASEMICALTQRNADSSIKEKIQKLNPEAIYCYSDRDALVMYNILSELGKKIPQDVAVLGFGYGSDLVKPTLSSVSLVSPLFGEAVISLLEKLLENPGMKPPQLDLPFGIFCGESTRKMNLNNLIEKY